MKFLRLTKTNDEVFYLRPELINTIIHGSSELNCIIYIKGMVEVEVQCRLEKMLELLDATVDIT